MHDDKAVETLLELHGRGYWLKIEAWRVEPSLGIPHGIRYSLTLHEPNGKRILGFDNAHAIKPPRKFKYAGRILAYDHQHRHVCDKGCHTNSRIRTSCWSISSMKSTESSKQG